MAFTFLHAADLHLGSPFKGLSTRNEDVAKRFANASRDAFVDLVDQAIASEVAFALIAGDIYDGQWSDTAIGHFFNREIARFARAGIPVFMVKGNHDAESIVTRSLPLPEGVWSFSTRSAETRRLDDLRVAIHGRSFPDREVNENFALTYPAAVEGWFNIGMLHTSLTGRPPHAPYAPCSLDDLRTRGYDYWALGHVHDYEEVSREPWIVYPGNLQGRSIRECGPKGAVLVDVADGRIAAVRRLVVDKARFAEVNVDISDLDDESAVFARIRASFDSVAAAAEGRMLAVRVRLTGAAPIHRHLVARQHRLNEDVQATLDHVTSDVWLEKLSLASRDPEDGASKSTSAALIDTSALLAGLEQDAHLVDEARRLIEDVTVKMPASARSDDDGLADIDALLAEARALVLARAGRPELR